MTELGRAIGGSCTCQNCRQVKSNVKTLVAGKIAEFVSAKEPGDAISDLIEWLEKQ